MEIQHQHHLSNGRFFIQEGQQELAYMSYIMTDDKTLLIDHTVVGEQLGGQGVGRKLVDAGVQFARAKGYSIIPQCPYARSVFEKTPEYADVWLK